MLATLNVDIDRIFAKAKENGLRVARATALELQSKVINKSPFDKGRLRGNWNVSLNLLDNAEYSADISGASAISRGLGALNTFKQGDTIFITNSLPYVQKLEFGLYGDGDKTVGGFSKQAPQGFVRITYLEVQNDLNRIAKAVIK